MFDRNENETEMGVIYHASLPNLERTEREKNRMIEREPRIPFLFFFSFSLTLSHTHTETRAHTLSLYRTHLVSHAQKNSNAHIISLSLSHAHAHAQSLSQMLLPLQFHPIRPALIFVHAWLKYKRSRKKEILLSLNFNLLFKYLNEWLLIVFGFGTKA